MGNTPKEPLQSRRHFLSSLLEAGLSAPATWAKSKLEAAQGVPGEAHRQTAVAPPGAISHDHLNSLCDGCGLCIKDCPTKVLKPSTSEYPLPAIAQPVLDFSRGWCDYDCTACSQSCPRGAIQPLDIDTKQSTQIGLAQLVKSLCINSSDAPACTICRDVCPASAIKMRDDYSTPLITIEGSAPRRRVFPEIEAILCIGCGLCEFRCPSQPAKAIHVEGLKIHEEN